MSRRLAVDPLNRPAIYELIVILKVFRRDVLANNANKEYKIRYSRNT